MGKDLDPKCKRCRREGEKLFLKGERCHSSKCAIVKRNYTPGQHGPNKRSPQLTEYGIRLRAKQSVKRIYGLRETQFSNLSQEATNKVGNTAEYFVYLLESRLDNIVFRAGYALSRRQARQIVTHGHFMVNDRKVDIPSYRVKEGDVIKMSTTKANKKIWEDIRLQQEASATERIPDWLQVDRQKMSVKVAGKPNLKELAENLQMKFIIEFYSK